MAEITTSNVSVQNAAVNATTNKAQTAAVNNTAVVTATAPVAAVSAVKETSTLSSVAKASAEFDKSNAAWDKGVAAFNKLPEGDRTELLGRMDTAYAKQLAAHPEFNDAQKAETLWATQANEAATWAGEKAALNIKNGNFEGGADAARNLGELYYSANDYLAYRDAYLGDHDGIHGAVGSVDFTLVDKGRSLAPSDQASAPLPKSDISTYFPVGSEAAKNVPAMGYFKEGLAAYDSLPETDRVELSLLIEGNLKRAGGVENLSQEEANDLRAQTALVWAWNGGQPADGSVRAQLADAADMYNMARGY